VATARWTDEGGDAKVMDEEAELRLFNKLDEQQSAVVRHMDGPALVVAGAGAGKTTTLVRRVAHLIHRGVDPTTILLLTFTRNAAQSMTDRARSFDAEAGRIASGTFHSVASRLIRDNHTIFGLAPHFTVLDPSDVEDTFKRLLAENPMEGASPRASTVAKVVSYAVNTMKPVDAVVARRWPKWQTWAGDIDRLKRLYDAYKRKHQCVDFDDLLRMFVALAEDPASGPDLRRRFRYVMCDEVQDCNALQMRILYALGRDGGNVMAVGDPSQSIYGFRGAAPGTMYEIRDAWPDTKLLLIETNYRSTPEIVGCADSVDRSMARRIERHLVASRKSHRVKPTLATCADKPTEACHIADLILDKRDEGVPYKEQAVLVRSMRNLRHVELELAARNIPTVVRGGIRIHEAGHVKDVLAPLRLLANHEDEPAWMRLLSMMPKIGEKSALKVARELVPQPNLARAVDALANMALTKPTLALAVSVLRDVQGPGEPAAMLYAARRSMEDLLSERYPEDWDARKKDIDALIDIAAGQTDLDEFLRTLTIDVSVDQRATYEGEPPDEEGVVTLATIHSSKGLEWDCVYMPSFIQGHLPSGFADPDDDPDEERRLMYVLVTRAKNELVLMRPQMALVKGRPMMVDGSGFEHIVRPHCRETQAGPSSEPQTMGLGLRGMRINAW